MLTYDEFWGQVRTWCADNESRIKRYEGAGSDCSYLDGKSFTYNTILRLQSAIVFFPPRFTLSGGDNRAVHLPVWLAEELLSYLEERLSNHLAFTPVAFLAEEQAALDDFRALIALAMACVLPATNTDKETAVP